MGVGLETVKQIESQLQQRNYEGFLRWCESSSSGRRVPVGERRPPALPRRCTFRTSPRVTCSAPTSAGRRSWASSPIVHGRRQPRTGRGDHRQWRRTAWSSPTPRAASCWTASRATSPRPRRWTRLLETEDMKLDAVLDLGGPGGRGRQADRRSACLPQRLRSCLPRGVHAAEEGRRLRRLRRRAVPARTTTPRRRSASGSRVYHTADRADHRLLQGPSGLLPRSPRWGRWRTSRSGAVSRRYPVRNGMPRRQPPPAAAAATLGDPKEMLCRGGMAIQARTVATIRRFHRAGAAVAAPPQASPQPSQSRGQRSRWSPHSSGVVGPERAVTGRGGRNPRTWQPVRTDSPPRELVAAGQVAVSAYYTTATRAATGRGTR